MAASRCNFVSSALLGSVDERRKRERERERGEACRCTWEGQLARWGGERGREGCSKVQPWQRRDGADEAGRGSHQPRHKAASSVRSLATAPYNSCDFGGVILFYAPPAYFSSFLPTVLNRDGALALQKHCRPRGNTDQFISRECFLCFPSVFPHSLRVQKNPAFRKLISLARLGSHIQMTAAHFWKPPIPLSLSNSSNLSSTTLSIFGQLPSPQCGRHV